MSSSTDALLLVVSQWLPEADVQPSLRVKTMVSSSLMLHEAEAIVSQVVMRPRVRIFFTDAGLSKRVLIESQEQLVKAIESTEKFSAVEEVADEPTYCRAMRLYVVEEEDYQAWQQRIAGRAPSEEWRELARSLMRMEEESEELLRPFQLWAESTSERKNACEEDGQTLLHKACALDLGQTTRLLATCIDAFARDASGMSCLHLAVLADNQTAVEALLKSLDRSATTDLLRLQVGATSGTRLTPIAWVGETAVELAQRLGSEKMRRILLSYTGNELGES